LRIPNIYLLGIFCFMETRHFTYGRYTRGK